MIPHIHIYIHIYVIYDVCVFVSKHDDLITQGSFFHRVFCTVMVVMDSLLAYRIYQAFNSLRPSDAYMRQ